MSTVRDLIERKHLKRLVHVKSSALLGEIQTVMVLNGISRVAVIDGGDGGHTLRGIVRMRELFEDGLRGGAHEGSVTARELTARQSVPPFAGVDEPLFGAVGKLAGVSELLVKDGNLFTHILTPRGVATWLAEYTERFYVLEQLETALRRQLEPFQGARLQSAVGVAKVEELSPSHYAEACRQFREDIPPIGCLDPETVHELLRRFAERRNEVMHFRVADTDALRADLKRFRELREWIEKS